MAAQTEELNGLSSERGTLRQIFRVLCVPVPECATGSSKRPLHMYLKTDNALQAEFGAE